MAKKPASIDEYLATLTAEQRATMQRLRETINAAAPGAEEGISYAIPVVKLDGQPVFWFAAWKEHYSLYPLTEAVQKTHAAELKDFKTLKGTIRFPASHPLPFGFVKKLVKTRVAEIRAGGR